MKKLQAITVMILILFTVMAHANEIEVTGKITDAESGEALPYVNVMIKHTKIGTVSDLNGEYRIVVADEKSVLVYSLIGMEGNGFHRAPHQ